MSSFADAAIYDEYDGRRHVGKAAIRDAFVPQFRGDFGRIRFETEDLFVDEAEEKALVSWTCTVERGGRILAWRGLDVLHFENGLLREKQTYGKAEKLALAERPL
jgi:ketosteroid isomerase-like protein